MTRMSDSGPDKKKENELDLNTQLEKRTFTKIVKLMDGRKESRHYVGIAQRLILCLPSPGFAGVHLVDDFDGGPDQEPRNERL